VNLSSTVAASGSSATAPGMGPASIRWASPMLAHRRIPGSLRGILEGIPPGHLEDQRNIERQRGVRRHLHRVGDAGLRAVAPLERRIAIMTGVRDEAGRAEDRGCPLGSISTFFGDA
jgi:hypothetical protein